MDLIVTMAHQLKNLSMFMDLIVTMAHQLRLKVMDTFMDPDVITVMVMDMVKCNHLMIWECHLVLVICRCRVWLHGVT